MASTFQMTVTPDASLNLEAMTFTVSLEDPTDFQVFVATYQDLLHLPTQDGDGNPIELSTHDFIKGWVAYIMSGTMNEIVGWVKSQKVSSVTVTSPPLSISE